ncbi:MAG: hypothetical protein AABZ00_16360 [Chloroflexota bacterium]|mgnify:CR=1 FL=1
MKLVLISPKGPLYRHRGGIFKKNLRYAPLTLTTPAAYDSSYRGNHVAQRRCGKQDDKRHPV